MLPLLPVHETARGAFTLLPPPSAARSPPRVSHPLLSTVEELGPEQGAHSTEKEQPVLQEHVRVKWTCRRQITKYGVI